MKSRNAIIGNVKIKKGIVYKKINNPKCGYLFDYLNTMNFNNIPSYRFVDDYVTYDYIDDLSIKNDLKAKEIINLIALLHNKTSYTKDLDLNLINGLKDKYLNHVNYYINYFNHFYQNNIANNYYRPSTYLILRNYTLIKDYLNLTKDLIMKWYDNVINNNHIRLSIIHNNLSLSHFIHNQDNYLISWDHFRNDFPMVDLAIFYQKYYNQFDFSSLFTDYLKINPLTDDEMMLFKILLLLNFTYDEELTQMNRLKNDTIFILYLNKTISLIKVL